MKSVVKRSVFVRRILYLVISTIVLFGILNTVSFLFIANGMFKKMQVKELEPRSQAIEHLVLSYQKGITTKSELDKQLLMASDMWGAIFYAYDEKGNVIIQNEGILTSKLGIAPKPKIIPDLNQVFRKHLDLVLAGQQVVSTSGPLVIVGRPIVDNGTVSGGVFLTEPPEELKTALFGLNMSMILTSLCVFLLMIFPVYKVTRYIVNPLKQMSDVAINMANGALNEHANEGLKGEIGELGRSLNYLSARLSETISALKIERNRLKQAIDGLAEGIIAIDNTGNITHANPAIYRIFNVNQEDSRMDIVPNQELWEDFDTVILQGYTIVRSINWKQIELRVTICPLEDEGHNIVGAVGLFRDVTESERLEQTRREYVANVSHELRTPVSALRALCETLIDDMVPDEETKKHYYCNMLHEIMRLSRLINDLLTLSRLQSDRVSVYREAFQINEIMENVAERYVILADEKDINFSFYPVAEDLEVYSSIDLVEQVLIILLDNAIKYTMPEGRISLYASVTDNIVKVSVSDTGIGIDPIDLPHIFERFYKSDKAHSTQGTGLGLAIAFEIMKQLGEQIHVESELGKGSIFTFTLSCIPEQAP